MFGTQGCGWCAILQRMPLSFVFLFSIQPSPNRSCLSVLNTNQIFLITTSMFDNKFTSLLFIMRRLWSKKVDIYIFSSERFYYCYCFLSTTFNTESINCCDSVRTSQVVCWLACCHCFSRLRCFPGVHARVGALQRLHGGQCERKASGSGQGRPQTQRHPVPLLPPTGLSPLTGPVLWGSEVMSTKFPKALTGGEISI